MITRRKDYSKKEPSRDSHKVYVVCEGTETEPNYFGFFEGLSSNLQIIILPPENGTDPVKLMELAESIFFGDDRRYTVDYSQNDRVWFVIDTDSWEREGKIDVLRSFCAEKNSDISKQFDEVKSYSAWNVAQSNPSFEIWLYYHFYDVRPTEAEVEKYVTFKDFLHHSISGGYNYDKDPVRLSDAIVHSKKNYSMQEGTYSPERYSTEMHFLGNEIYSFVRNDIDRLRNKIG